VQEVTKLAETTRADIAERNRMLAEGTYRAVYDPTQTYVLPKEEPLPAAPDLAPLQRALMKLQESAKGYQAAFDSADARARLTSSAETRARLDQVLMNVERSMTREAGLPRRPWFKHQIYAPGFYTGYGVKTLPGVREAVEQHNWAEAAEQTALAAQTLERVASEIDRATALLQGK
jgi:N-acetylated-alpha-linked acidic dipeptidase